MTQEQAQLVRDMFEEEGEDIVYIHKIWGKSKFTMKAKCFARVCVCVCVTYLLWCRGTREALLVLS